MAHQIEQQSNGNYSYIGQSSAWHHLGYVTGHLMSYQEIKDYCLNWEAEKKQLVSPYDGSTPIDAYGIFRTDNHKFLGSVGKGYNPISHDLGFAIVSQLLEEKTCFATAGVLNDGCKVWGLGVISESQLGDDKSVNYLLFTTGYDGLSKFSFKLVKERVVCANTLQIALRELGKYVAVKHTVNAETLLKDRLKAFESVTSEIKSLDDKLEMLANKKMTKETIQDIFAKLFPLKEAKDQSGNEVLVSPKRRDGILADILDLYDSNDGNAFPEQRGTAYSLLQSITNYVDHKRSTHNEESNPENRSISALFGSGEALKQEAFEVITNAATGMQELVKKTVFTTPSDNAPKKKASKKASPTFDASSSIPSVDAPSDDSLSTPLLDSLLDS